MSSLLEPKRCTKCNDVPEEGFRVMVSRSGRLSSWCRPCEREAARIRKRESKGVVKETKNPRPMPNYPLPTHEYNAADVAVRSWRSARRISGVFAPCLGAR